MSQELPILLRRQQIPAEHYKEVTRGYNAIRRVTGDKRYIAAEMLAGSLTVHWVGPTVAAAGSIIRRLVVKSSETDYLVCRFWDGDVEGSGDIFVARSYPDKIDYPADTVIYATQPTGGTGVVATTEAGAIPVNWLDSRLTVGQFFPVQVTKDGGANGTNTTKATYTYTVKTLADVTIGVTVAVTRPRENGAVVFQAGSTGYGSAFYNADGTLILWDAGEVYDTAVCS